MALIISRRSFYCPNFATAPDALKELHKELIAIEGELEKTLWEKINSLL